MKLPRGVSFILIGLALSLVGFIYSDNYDSQMGFLASISKMEVVIDPGKEANDPLGKLLTEPKGRKTIAYKHVLAGGTIFILLGVSLTYLDRGNRF